MRRILYKSDRTVEPIQSTYPRVPFYYIIFHGRVFDWYELCPDLAGILSRSEWLGRPTKSCYPVVRFLAVCRDEIVETPWIKMAERERRRARPAGSPGRNVVCVACTVHSVVSVVACM